MKKEEPTLKAKIATFFVLLILGWGGCHMLMKEDTISDKDRAKLEVVEAKCLKVMLDYYSNPVAAWKEYGEDAINMFKLNCKFESKIISDSEQKILNKILKKKS